MVDSHSASISDAEEGGRVAALLEMAECYAFGWMFWLTRKVLSGSYFALI